MFKSLVLYFVIYTIFAVISHYITDVEAFRFGIAFIGGTLFGTLTEKCGW